jgi:cytochrome c-type biogenesis protein
VTGLGDWFRDQVTSGTMLLALPVAVVAGAVSFFSPCVVPLLPGYVSYATGLSGADLATARRGRMLAGTALFVLGFTVWFVVVGMTAGALGGWLFAYRRGISVGLGVVTIVVGLVFAGVLDGPLGRVLPWLQRDVRFHRLPAVGLGAAPLLGVLFAIGWTPCLGPTITAVQGLALTEATAGRGAALSVAYSLGLGLPFLALGLAYRRMLGALRWVRRHQVWITRGGGLMLVAVGVLLVTGWWDVFTTDLRGWFGPGFEAPV